MDNRIANDMISSGMIPSGKKNKEDLSRTQYGSAPSPSKLMDAYKSMYGNKEEVINEHHKKDADGNTIPHEGEELNELKTRTMLDYIDKASDSASKELGKAEKTTSRKKEVKARLKMDSRERGIEMAKDKIMKRVKTEEVDLFDVVSGVFVAEGYEEKDAYKVMSQLTEEQLNEIAVTGTLATLGMIGTKLLGGAKVAAAAASKGLTAGKALASKGLGAAKTAATAGAKKITSAAQTGMSKASDALSKVSNIAKPKGNKQLSLDLGKAGQSKPTNTMGNKMADLGKFVGDEVKDEIKRKVLQGNDGGSNKISKTGQLTAPTANLNQSADLFDIVKGRLLDEGLSEEEIKDIMLTLTPDEIMEELSDIVKRNDAINLARAKERAKQREVPQNVRDAQKRQTTAGGPKDKGENKYTTQDKKTIIDYHKNRESM